jgi:hypothetical protein
LNLSVAPSSIEHMFDGKQGMSDSSINRAAGDPIRPGTATPVQPTQPYPKGWR